MGYRGIRRTSAVLQHRSAILWTLAALLAACVFAAYQQGKAFALQQIGRKLDQRIEAHELYFLDNFGQYSLLPETIASSPYVRQLLKQPDARNAAIANRTLAEITDNVKSDRIWVLNAAGTTVADSMWNDPASIVGHNFAYRGYFKDAMAGRTGHFIGVGYTSQIIGYFISRPVVVDGKIGGAVAVRLSQTFKKFESVLWRNWKEHGELTLVTDENGVLFMSAIPEWTFRTLLPMSDAARDALRKSLRYGDRDFAPISWKSRETLPNGMRFIRFAELPGRTFIQKSYDTLETGRRIYLHVDAQEYWSTVIVYTGAALLSAIVVFLMVFVILQRWKYQTQLVQAAIRDSLTGLFTRLYMQEWLQDAIDTHARYPERGFALLLFDVDHFKSINDTYGHVVGDEVLRGIAKIIGGAIRGDDIAVRFGGEEIAVFARADDPAEVGPLGERIRRQVEQQGVQTSRGHVAMTLSGGIAVHAIGESSEELFERADKKLYEAKNTGRNRVLSQ